jgi:hypothetical protein
LEGEEVSKFILGGNINLDDLNQTFRGNAEKLVGALPFDVFVASGFRTVAHQLELIHLHQTDPIHHAPANPPEKSAHCVVTAEGTPDGRAMDLHPMPPLKANYKLMKVESAQFGITFPTTEKWHAQDSAWKPGVG